MVEEEFERIPRSFYPGISSIREAALEYNIPEVAIDDMLDRVEKEIVDCLNQQEEADVDGEEDS